MVEGMPKSTATIVVIALGMLLVISSQVSVGQHNPSLKMVLEEIDAQPVNLGTWRIEDVDEEYWVGHDTSLALDKYNRPHISYWDLTNRYLKYAKWTGSFWDVEYVNWTGISARTSIALDENGHAHISFAAKYPHTVLRYAEWTGVDWSIETVDPTEGFGGESSVALDSSGNPHIAYVGNSSLKYAKWTGSEWSIETVDSSGNVGWFPSIVINSKDLPRISYHDRMYDDLKYAKWTGSEWLKETVDATQEVGEWTSLALGDDDFPHISYYDVSNEDLKYAKWTGSEWLKEVVDAYGRMGWFSSIALDASNNPHISYQGKIDHRHLKYAEWTGSEWSIETVDSRFSQGLWTSIEIDTNDLPHISYFDDWNGNLMYATKAEPGPVPPPCSVGLNIDPDTLNLKSMGRWITAYMTTKNCRAQDIDPSSLLLNDEVEPAWWSVQNNTTLMVKFDRAAVQAILHVSDSVDIKITGQWKHGGDFEAHDTIRVIDPVHSQRILQSFLPRVSKSHSNEWPSIYSPVLRVSLARDDEKPITLSGAGFRFEFASKAGSPRLG
jgi:hypothetical protein